jgi:hypothetical protein
MPGFCATQTLNASFLLFGTDEQHKWKRMEMTIEKKYVVFNPKKEQKNQQKNLYILDNVSFFSLLTFCFFLSGGLLSCSSRARVLSVYRQTHQVQSVISLVFIFYPISSVLSVFVSVLLGTHM